LNASQTTTVQANKSSSGDENKAGFRTKTVSTRLTPDELAQVESAAEESQKPLSEWLRETALTATKQRVADPIELLLGEVWAVRYDLLRLFHAGAQATAEEKPLLPESVLKIRDKTDREKVEQARRMLADFFARPIGKDGAAR